MTVGRLAGDDRELRLLVTRALRQRLVELQRMVKPIAVMVASFLVDTPRHSGRAVRLVAKEVAGGP